MLVLRVDVSLISVENAPWAMVPLNPNELRRELLLSTEVAAREITSTGIWNGFDDTIDDKCAFSLRKNNLIDDIKHKRHTRAVAR